MNTLNSIFEWAILASLRASALVLVVLATQWVLKHRLPSRWRYALWLPVLAALLLPSLPVLPSWMKWPVAADSVNAASAGMAVPGRVATLESSNKGTQLEVFTGAFDGSKSRSETSPTPAAQAVNWRAWLVWAWSIGAVVVGVFVFTSFALTLRRMRSAALPVDETLRNQIAETARVVGLRRVPRILKSTAVASPAVCGLLRPCLLLNENFQQELSDEEAEMVLCHELMHIRRGDLTVNALVCALLALHWWNPLLWLAFLRVRADREAACDAQVLEGAPAARRAAYGQTLLKLETEFTPSGLCLGFVGILQRGGALRERIHAIISQPELSQPMKTTIMLSIAILTVAGIATASEGQPKSEAAAAKLVRVDVKTLFDPMVKMFLAELAAEERSAFEKAKFSVSELQIEDLGENNGLQIFELTSGPDSGHEIFTHHSGELKKLPILSDHGFPSAIVDGGAVYFTSLSGSGISTTTLHKLSPSKDKGFVHENLGVIAANPEEPDTKENAKKMHDVISKLKPVTKGESANAAPSQAVEVDQIKDIVSIIKRGEEMAVNLKVDGNRLLQRASGEKSEPKDVTVKVSLKETTATPFPVSGDPTRPFLSMSNSSDKPLHFRALARLKGKKEFRIVDELPMTVEPGDLSSIYCWESGSEVEEVILYQVTFAP